MSYPYFFITKDNINGSKIIVDGEELNHLANVLRARKGDLVEVSDNNSYRYKTEILDIYNSKAILMVKERIKIATKVPCIVLFQCVLKKNAMEIVIQKTTEIGIDRIVPIFSSRVVPDSKKTKNKVERWKRIAKQSSKQCKRDFICEVSPPMDIFDIKVSKFNVSYLPYEGNKKSDGIGKSKFNKIINLGNFYNFSDNISDNSRKINDIGSIGYIVGPEGGFENEEVSFLENKGAVVINFGKNILRSETASVYFLSVLDYVLQAKAAGKSLNL